MTQSLSSFRRALFIGSACLVAALAGAATSLRAQPAAPKPAAVAHIAVVNLGKVMDGLNEGKDLKLRLDQQVADSKKQLEDINTQLKKIDADLELKKEQKDSPDYRALLGRKLVLTSQGRALEQVLQQLIDEQEGATVRAMYLKMTDAIKKIADRDGWDLVLRDDHEIEPPEKKRDGTPLTGREVRGVIDQRSILSVNPSIDITQSVITQMNNDYKAPKR